MEMLLGRVCRCALTRLLVPGGSRDAACIAAGQGNAASVNTTRDQDIRWEIPATSKAMVIFRPGQCSPSQGLKVEPPPGHYVMPPLFICVIKARSKLVRLLSTGH